MIEEEMEDDNDDKDYYSELDKIDLRVKPTIRQTSIDCYHEIKANGLLSKRRLEVYEALLKHAPCTSSEAIINTGWSLHAVSSRFTELRNMGCIIERGTKTCSISGMTRIVWDISDE